MLPSPHGHRPAIARTSVLLPVPDSPATSTRSPAAIATSASLTTAVPSSSVTERSCSRSAAPSVRRARCGRRRRPLGALQGVERDHQRGDAAGRGGPVGEPRIVVDQPVERGLHDGEGGGRLHHLAERHRAVEEFRRAQDDRHHRRDVAAGLRDHRGAHGLEADVAPAPQHRCATIVDAVALLVLAAEQRDALAVLAQRVST